MASPSPPKPWERAGATAGANIIPATASSTGDTRLPASSTSLSPTNSSAPPLPNRPSSLTAAVNRNASAYSPYGASRMGPSPYGGALGSSFTSPYSRIGGYGSMYGGGMGGMGGYGAYGSSMGGMGAYGGYGGGMYGGMGGQMDPNDPNNLTNSWNQSTQTTFQMIEGIVGAFGGFAQMLESTYMATHSSFFAMVSVAEQFGNLRNTLGSILGIFAMMRWLRTLVAKLTGRPPPADATALTPAAFARFEGRAHAVPSHLPDGRPNPAARAHFSKKPLFFFLAAAFGLPYLMGKLIRSLAHSHDEEERRRQAAAATGYAPDGQPAPPLDPSTLDFCRVLYDFAPESGGTHVQGVDLAVRKGDLVAVLSKSDPMGNACEWWRCRARDGRVGYLPAVYLEDARRGPAAIKSASQSSSRASTMLSGKGGAAAVAPSAKQGPTGPVVPGKAGDISVESFQKSQFYS